MIKSVLALAFVAVALGAPYNPYQFQPQTYQSQYKGYTPYYQNYATTARPVVVPVTPAPRYYTNSEANVPILREFSDLKEDGSYQYAYETGNGIAVQESGGPKAIGQSVGNAAQGSYSYTSPEGKLISISYIADENGFRAVGDAIPTPPPVPPAIARALEYIARSQNVPVKYY